MCVLKSGGCWSCNSVQVLSEFRAWDGRGKQWGMLVVVVGELCEAVDSMSLSREAASFGLNVNVCACLSVFQNSMLLKLLFSRYLFSIK